jgi:hypothetical protein
MKKLLSLLLLAATANCFAQTFQVNNLQVNGTTTLGVPLATQYGGLGANNSASTGIPVFNAGSVSMGTTTGTGSIILSNSPAFSGIPTAPTQTNGVNNTSVATTAYTANAQICPSIMDHGGDRTGASDNTAAFFLTVAANPTGQVCVAFPPGKFRFNSALSYTNPAAPSSIMIKGAGQDVTTLFFANSTSGINIVSNAPGSSVHVRDMTITTGQAAGGNAGIALTQTSSLNQFSMSDIYNVTLRGDDNVGTGGSHYWSFGILINGQDSVNVESVTVYGNGSSGVGLQCQGNGVQYAIYNNISKSVFNGLGTGVIYSSYCQGMTITQTNFQNDSIGFQVPSGAAGVLAQLQISDSQFATTSDAINIQTNVGGTMIHDNDIFVHTGHSGIFIANTIGGTIHGNTINTDGSGSAGASGIVIGSGGQTFVITGNQIGGVANCIQYQAGSSFNQNLGNALACTTAVVDNGTSNTKGVATN